MSHHVDLIINESQGGAWPGGRGTLIVGATDFASATIALELEGPNDTWVAVGDEVTFTANGVGNFELPPCRIRASASGGTPSGGFVRAVRINA